ncbi:MAG TPA: GNAT family N-acetyltransferase [Ktedonobacteraceae bacterium]|nr:GNAT family N-acetyltransferase [Ktedonobacteraceae bacterium]
MKLERFQMKIKPIRLAQAAEQKAVVACVRAAYSKYVVRMNREPAPMHADYATLIKKGVVYVLADDDVIQGVLVMMPEKKYMFVENVAVDPHFQGQGLGLVLMTFVEQQARNEQLNEIRLYTNELMTENLRFYHKLRFEEESRRVQDGYQRVFLRKVLK